MEAGQRDEIGFLVESFNEMTQALKSASQEAEESRAELQAQGEYLETVLGNLSSGVLTLDHQGRIITDQRRVQADPGLAGGFDAQHWKPHARTPGKLLSIAPFLEPFVAAINQQIKRGRIEWQQEIRIDRPGTPLVLLMRGSRLPLVSLPGEQAEDGMLSFSMMSPS